MFILHVIAAPNEPLNTPTDISLDTPSELKHSTYVVLSHQLQLVDSTLDLLIKSWPIARKS